MRSDWSPLAPTFRSRLQGQVLALVLLKPDQEWTISDLARQVHAPLTTVQGEVSRLVDGRVLTERKLGRSRLVRANVGNPALLPLTQLTLASFGPQVIVREEFSGLGADAVYIFGSWAARFHGIAGGTPLDIDVLAIGDGIERRALFDAAARSEKRLGIEVNPVSRTREQWEHADEDPLLGDVTTKPMVLAWAREE
ncbi:MAG: ArsR family transcriptional regulator [Actinobacteria bacterium HGW-Actinobacteria-4]|nr:MAG: ArsR family transcriptional regulator [Actinobacteria bacterium HGW-Actinobacteria-4]